VAWTGASSVASAPSASSAFSTVLSHLLTVVLRRAVLRCAAPCLCRCVGPAGQRGVALNNIYGTDISVTAKMDLLDRAETTFKMPPDVAESLRQCPSKEEAKRMLEQLSKQDPDVHAAVHASLQSLGASLLGERKVCTCFFCAAVAVEGLCNSLARVRRVGRHTQGLLHDSAVRRGHMSVSQPHCVCSRRCVHRQPHAMPS
jgi:hypothetical protein